MVGKESAKVLLLAYSKSKRQFNLLELSQVFSVTAGRCAFLTDGHALKMRRAGVQLLRIPARQHAMLSAGVSSSGPPWFPDEYSGDVWFKTRLSPNQAAPPLDPPLHPRG